MQGWKTFVGLVIAAVGAFLTQTGYDATLVQELQAEVVGLADNLMTWGGLLYAAYGRIVAKVNLLTGLNLQ